MNAVAVRLTQKVGVKTVIPTAQRLGISRELRPSVGIALGASEVTLLDLTGAYAAFAHQPRRVLPYHLSDLHHPSGQLLFPHTPSSAHSAAPTPHHHEHNTHRT